MSVTTLYDVIINQAFIGEILACGPTAALEATVKKLTSRGADTRQFEKARVYSHETNDIYHYIFSLHADGTLHSDVQ